MWVFVFSNLRGTIKKKHRALQESLGRVRDDKQVCRYIILYSEVLYSIILYSPVK